MLGCILRFCGSESLISDKKVLYDNGRELDVVVQSAKWSRVAGDQTPLVILDHDVVCILTPGVDQLASPDSEVMALLSKTPQAQLDNVLGRIVTGGGDILF